MLGVEITAYDKKVYEEQLKDFLPEKIVDIHLHMWEPGSKPQIDLNEKGMQNWPDIVAPDFTYEDLELSYGQMFPDKKVKQVLMTDPTCYLDDQNAYVLRKAKENNLPALYCTTYKTTGDEIRRAIADGFCGIKPYLNNCPEYIPANEVRIYDFLTPEHLEVCNELGAVIMLHIPRSKRLADPVNLAQIAEIDEKYPNAKVLIAHIGRAYCDEDFGDGFKVLSKTKNLYVEFTATTHTNAMVEAIKAVGVKRFMFGSDMPITKMRMYRIIENGTYVNVVPRGMYGDVSDDPHMRETDETEITSFMYEELLAFKEAAKILNLSKQDVEDIMCNNACRLFDIKF
ncbi:MAG: amidohydrolase [Clostridia bacterium]|nr:amidohydrolase [Clostridia bacterium]